MTPEWNRVYIFKLMINSPHVFARVSPVKALMQLLPRCIVKSGIRPENEHPDLIGIQDSQIPYPILFLWHLQKKKHFSLLHISTPTIFEPSIHKPQSTPVNLIFLLFHLLLARFHLTELQPYEHLFSSLIHRTIIYESLSTS